jgi:2-C-methyl-D-erythritol 4-phosphate cytidylyltransferase
MNKRQRVVGVIPAAGVSERFGGSDKMFTDLAGKPVLARVIDVFQGCNLIDEIILVTNEESMEACRELVNKEGWTKVTEICPGGRRRQDSVLAALNRILPCNWVVIHDGARPLLTEELIVQGLEAARETGSAVAAVPVKDTIKVAKSDNIVKQTPTRGTLWAVQTPQVFRFDLITEAYLRIKDEVTDDATMIEKMGYRVKLYTGSYDNIKITTPEDLSVAEALWRKREG